jgi:hypothetical protein
MISWCLMVVNGGECTGGWWLMMISTGLIKRFSGV